MMKQNWDYSCEMFRQAANLVPDNVLYRQSLRGATERKYNDNKTGVSMAGMRLMTTKASIKKSRMSKDWNSVIQLCEDGLALNPWDPGLNADLGDAMNEVGFTQVAEFCYQRAVKGDPNNKAYLRTLGLILESRENFDEAITMFTKVAQIDKLDGEARSKITALLARKAQKDGGFDGAASTREIQRPVNRGKDVADGPGMSVSADLERAIRKDPGNKDNYLKLADYLKREGNLEKTKETLAKALEVSNGDLKIQEQLEDVELDILRKDLALAKEEALADTEDKFAKRKYQEIKAGLLKREIEIFESRMESYPQDMALKYELAMRYMQDKRHQSAIPLFQKSRGDNRRKVPSLLNLGKCFIAEKQFALARRQFEQAIPECNPDSDLEIFLDLHYFTGRVCEELKDKEAAIKNYQTVLEYDYDYKDNRERLQKLESGDTVDG